MGVDSEAPAVPKSAALVPYGNQNDRLLREARFFRGRRARQGEAFLGAPALGSLARHRAASSGLPAAA